MNILSKIKELTGLGGRQAKPATAPRGIMQMVQARRPTYEDSHLIPGPQGMVPINADVRNFNLRPPGYEDGAFVQGPQGYNPINADIANFRGPMMQPNMLPQFEDAYTPDLALNRTYTQGNPQLSRSSYRVQDARLPRYR